LRNQVFKVFKSIDGRLVSAVVSGGLAVDYEPGKWSAGPCGTPVLAFTSLEAAQEFVRDVVETGFTYEIWLCEAQGVRRIRKVVLYPMASPSEVLSYWMGVRRGIPTIKAPRCTVACSAVKPEKFIELRHMRGRRDVWAR